MARTGNGNHRFENMALVVLALIVASIAAYAVLTHPTSGEQDVDLERTMRGDYKPVLSALVRAAGQECDRVCSASIAEPDLGGARRLRVACAVEARHITCAQAIDFEIVVNPMPEPSR